MNFLLRNQQSNQSMTIIELGEWTIFEKAFSWSGNIGITVNDQMNNGISLSGSWSQSHLFSDKSPPPVANDAGGSLNIDLNDSIFFDILQDEDNTPAERFLELAKHLSGLAKKLKRVGEIMEMHHPLAGNIEIFDMMPPERDVSIFGLDHLIDELAEAKLVEKFDEAELNENDV